MKTYFVIEMKTKEQPRDDARAFTIHVEDDAEFSLVRTHASIRANEYKFEDYTILPLKVVKDLSTIARLTMITH